MIMRSLTAFTSNRLVFLLVEDTENNLRSHLTGLLDAGIIGIAEPPRSTAEWERTIRTGNYTGVDLIVFTDYLDAYDWIANAPMCHVALLDCKLDKEQIGEVKDINLEVAGIYLWAKLLSRRFHIGVETIVYSGHSDVGDWYEPFCQQDQSLPLQIMIKSKEFDNELKGAIYKCLSNVQSSFLKRADSKTLAELKQAKSQDLLDGSIKIRPGEYWTINSLFPVEAHQYQISHDKQCLQSIRDRIAEELRCRTQWQLTVFAEDRVIEVTSSSDRLTNEPRYFRPGHSQTESGVHRDWFYTIHYAAEKMWQDITDNTPNPGYFSAFELKDPEGSSYFDRDDKNVLRQIKRYFDHINEDMMISGSFFVQRAKGVPDWRLSTMDVSLRNRRGDSC